MAKTVDYFEEVKANVADIENLEAFVADVRSRLADAEAEVSEEEIDKLIDAETVLEYGPAVAELENYDPEADPRSVEELEAEVEKAEAEYIAECKAGIADLLASGSSKTSVIQIYGRKLVNEVLAAS